MMSDSALMGVISGIMLRRTWIGSWHMASKWASVGSLKAILQARETCNLLS